MAQQTVNNGDTGLQARTKWNANDTELYAGLHNAVTVTDTNTIDMTLTGQDIKADVLSVPNENTGNLKFWTGTQAQYDALTPVATTLYFIEEQGDVMPIKLGNNAYKPEGIAKVYLGSTLMYQSSDVDPRITAALAANCTMLLLGDLADGTNPGNNTDPTNPFVDSINSNDATLNGFAWTTTS